MDTKPFKVRAFPQSIYSTKHKVWESCLQRSNEESWKPRGCKTERLKSPVKTVRGILRKKKREKKKKSSSEIEEKILSTPVASWGKFLGISELGRFFPLAMQQLMPTREEKADN